MDELQAVQEEYQDLLRMINGEPAPVSSDTLESSSPAPVKPILKVQEIRGYDKVTPIPSAPDYLKGVLNLRGVIVPILDMRVKFRLPEVRYVEGCA